MTYLYQEVCELLLDGRKFWFYVAKLILVYAWIKDWALDKRQCLPYFIKEIMQHAQDQPGESPLIAEHWGPKIVCLIETSGLFPVRLIKRHAM